MQISNDSEIRQNYYCATVWQNRVALISKIIELDSHHIPVDFTHRFRQEKKNWPAPKLACGSECVHSEILILDFFATFGKTMGHVDSWTIYDNSI